MLTVCLSVENTQSLNTLESPINYSFPIEKVNLWVFNGGKSQSNKDDNILEGVASNSEIRKNNNLEWKDLNIEEQIIFTNFTKMYIIK